MGGGGPWRASFVFKQMKLYIKMYSLDTHSEHRNTADTCQIGKCTLYTNFNYTKKGNQNNKRRRL